MFAIETRRFRENHFNPFVSIINKEASIDIFPICISKKKKSIIKTHKDVQRLGNRLLKDFKLHHYRVSSRRRRRGKSSNRSSHSSTLKSIFSHSLSPLSNYPPPLFISYPGIKSYINRIDVDTRNSLPFELSFRLERFSPEGDRCL